MPHRALIVRRDESAGPPTALALTGPPAAFEELPGESQWHGWHGIRVHCRRLGAGVPVVLVHMVDMGASCIEWRRNAPALADAFDTYGVDLPGFGLSGVPEEAPRATLYLRFLSDFVARVRDEHGGAAPCAIGSGAGAAYLATIARSDPNAIRRLVLVAPTGVSACRPRALGGLAYRALKLKPVSSLAQAAVGGSSHTGILEHLQRDVYGDDARASASEADARYFVAHRPGSEAVERARLAGLLNVDLKPLISEIRTPTLLVWGRKASCPPSADVEVWREQSPQTLVRMFEESALCPHFEEPNKFNELVSEFLWADRMAA